MEFYKKYRPKTLQELIGQSEAVATINTFIKRKSFPHVILLSGASGCGKTTVARILKDLIGCSDADFIEQNCADFRSIDDVRSIRRSVGLSPMSGKARIWLLDECQQLPTTTQSGLLKLLEDTPKHVYFILATTDPGKLMKTIHGRCTEIKIKEMKSHDMNTLIKSVVKKEKGKITDEVIEGIIDSAEGSARKALVLLDQVLGLSTEDEQIEAVKAGTFKKQGIDLARALLDSKSQWIDIAKILKVLEDEPETVRYIVMGYARSILLSGGKLAGRAAMVIDFFSSNFYDSKAPGLALACWNVHTTKC